MTEESIALTRPFLMTSKLLSLVSVLFVYLKAHLHCNCRIYHGQFPKIHLSSRLFFRCFDRQEIVLRCCVYAAYARYRLSREVLRGQLEAVEL